MRAKTDRRSRIVATALLGSSLLLAPLTSWADQAMPNVTVHPEDQTKSGPSKPVDPDARLEADREAFFSARLAALHAGLSLTADQEALWPPVESAMRDIAKTGRRSWRRDRVKMRDMTSLERLKMRGDHLVQRGQAIAKLVDATGPLLGSLTAEQRGRLPALLRGVRARSVIARAFELRRDTMDLDGFGPDDRGMDGHGMDRQARDSQGRDTEGMNGGGEQERGMDDGRGGGMSQDDGERQGLNGQADDGDAPTMHHHRRHRQDDDADGFDDIAFPT